MTTQQPDDNTTDPVWDTIIVGAGSAGAVLAARLSEDSSRRVLLLEAGRDWRAGEAPAAMRSANPLAIILPPEQQAAWQWPGLMARRTKMQEPRLYWRGRGLGGSSAVNAQIAIRGVADAFDQWAEAGCEGWAFESLLPHFVRIEDDPVAVAEYHGRGGAVPVYRAPLELWGPVDRGLRTAALALGYPWNPDLNAPDGEGVSCYPINSRDGCRVSTNEAYLEPARGRPNLTIWTDALVDRILLDGTRATGVRAHLPERGWANVRANEVVLAAGAVHSPAILWRSGLGPEDELHRLGIATVRNIPEVGRNFIEHPVVRAMIPLRPEYRPRDPDTRHTNCCVTYSSRLAGAGRRDMIFIGFNHRGFELDGTAAPGSLGVGVFEAFSRGEVRLLSADPTRDPLIEANMLTDARDRERLCDGVRRLAALTAHNALAGIAERITFGATEQTPAEVAALPPDELDALLLAEASDAQHASGTCRMAAYEDPRGVVDPDGRVKGISGLRVADASIMPFDCRANTHFTTMMIGEAIAARIRAE